MIILGNLGIEIIWALLDKWDFLSLFWWSSFQMSHPFIILIMILSREPSFHFSDDHLFKWAIFSLYWWSSWQVRYLSLFWWSSFQMSHPFIILIIIFTNEPSFHHTNYHLFKWAILSLFLWSSFQMSHPLIILIMILSREPSSHYSDDHLFKLAILSLFW